MPTLTIDGREYEVGAGANVLHAALSLGLDLPYFCWHPALKSVGACRLCAVKQFRDASDTRGRLVMACLTPAADGALLSIADAEARAFRKSVLEWLMANHPHDCPVCDEGGECHLQDMTLMTGHSAREYRFPKRTYRNQYLGPFINHEMNRCIQCYRCVRFYNDYAGGADLRAFASRERVFFGRHADGALESEFSGNLVEVCPTGVFTDKTLKQHYARKWDLQTAPSVCVHCSLGCNTIPGERYGTLRRIRSRYNHEVNGYFLCDRGRFGYEFVNSERRIRQPLLRREGTLTPVSTDEALRRAGAILGTSAGVVGIGSPRASLEANFALRALAGPEHFVSGMAAGEARLVAAALRIMREGPARAPSLADVAQADAVLVLGEDVCNTAPMLALALRQSARQQPMRAARDMGIPDWHDAALREVVQDQKGPLFIATPAATRLDDLAAQTVRAAPEEIARLGFAVAHALDGSAPPAALPDDLRSLAEQIARALAEAERPLVVAGTSLGSEALLQAAANVAWALRSVGHACELCLVAPECNSLGVGLMGAGPLSAAIEMLQFGAADTLVVLENDLFRRADPQTVQTLLGAAKHVIVIDHLTNATTAHAAVVLPAATFAEGDGTLVNNEGRAQRFYQVFVPQEPIQESWRWLRDMLRAAGRGEDAPWPALGDIDAELASELPQLAAVTEIAPPADFRVRGAKIPRQPHRYSGRTAMSANISVHEPKPPEDRDSPLAFSMEGAFAPPPALASEFWSPGWNSAQAINKFQSEVGGPLHGGAPGRRLIEPPEDARPASFAPDPSTAAVQERALLVVPLYHVFGSEELSLLTPGIAELAPQPYLALHPADAAELGVAEGDLLSLAMADGGLELRPAGEERRLAVTFVPELARGVAGVPAGLPDIAGLQLPGECRITRVGEKGQRA
jgi:NADH-quinone oxidoreductase subunit G